MTSAPGHVFRFFVDATGVAGERVMLAPVDAAHMRVLRLEQGAAIEIVDATGMVWSATLDGDAAVLRAAAQSRADEIAAIELIAGALVGGRFDELVDGAVQAGATRIVPLAPRRADAQRLAARCARLQRIARAAAKQSKRTAVPEVAEPIDDAALLAGPVGIIVDPGAPQLLDAVVRTGAPVPRDAADDVDAGAGGVVRLLVGPAEGLDPALVAQLVDAGWVRGRLGPTILRTELAAVVAVAIAAMHAPPT